MTRLALLMVAVAALGCSKPSEEDCRKAIDNMQRLMGTENLLPADRIESEVRRCKGGSSKKAVDCAIKAQTLDDLRKCEFFKVPANAPGIGGNTGTVPPIGSAGSAAPAGSADPGAGSAPAGSAAPADGSAAAGSAAAPGSASGSAAPTGSAATPGAAAGSAATAPGAAVGSAK